MEQVNQRGVSVQHLMEMARPIMDWVFACDNPFFLSVDFNLKRYLSHEEKVSDVTFDVTFFYPDPEAEQGKHNDCIIMYTFDNEQRLNKKIALIQKALLSQSIEEVRDLARQAREYEL